MSSPDVSQPHDRLIRFTLGSKENAISFFQAYLPPKIATAIAWNEIELESGSYVDQALRQSESDLLFHAPIQKADGQTRELLIYLLLEHQSSSDRWLPLRLLDYMLGIWTRHRREQPSATSLPPILPLVLSQVAGGWRVSPQFTDLIDWPDGLEAELGRHLPAFEHLLIDLAQLSNDELGGNPMVRVVQELLKAAAEKKLMDWVERAAPLLRLISDPASMRALFTYFANAESNLNLSMLAAKMEVKGLPLAKDTIMTIAEQLRREGREEGRAEGRTEGILIGQIKTLERLLKRPPSSLDVLDQMNITQLSSLLALLEREFESR